MASSPRTLKDFSSLLSGRRGAGKVSPAHAFPLHTMASDDGYGVFANGTLTVLFSIPPTAYYSPAELALSLPPGGGLQAYRHFLAGEEPKTYLAVSCPIDYSYTFSPFKGFLNLFKPSFVGKELRDFDAATETTYRSILAAIEDAFAPEPVYALEGFEPVLTSLGMRRGVPDSVRFNMAFLALPDNRLGVLADCQAIPTRNTDPMPEPPEGLEALYCTTILRPSVKAHAELAETYRAQQSFLRTQIARKPGDKKGLAVASPVQGPDAGLELCFFRHYFFLLSPDARRLLLESERFFAAVNQAGYPTHPSLVANKDQYCHLFPGNVHALPDGLAVPLHHLDGIFERLHP